jgi:hypothetical protein
MRTFILAIAIFLSGALQVLATTYDYVGQPFTTFAIETYGFGGYYNGDCSLNCTSAITGFVTFNFDTSHYTGNLLLTAGDIANLSGGVDAGLSGSLLGANAFPYPSSTSWFNPPADTYGYTTQLSGIFTLVDGTITSWSLFGSASQVGCGGGPGCAAGASGVYSRPTSDSGYVDGYLITFSASNNGGGVWTEEIAAVPEPSTWAMMLIGFVAIGLFVRRRNCAPSMGLPTVEATVQPAVVV